MHATQKPDPVASAVAAVGFSEKTQPCNAKAAPMARLAGLEVRLALSSDDILAAQQLRHEVFFQEMSAVDQRQNVAARRIDADAYDAICDHLIVEDLSLPEQERVVATYRLVLQSHLDRSKERHAAPRQFYSQQEYDVETMILRHPGARFMELGRSCVKVGYRNKRTLELLWAGIWSYVRMNRVDVMFGCASFEGCNPSEHGEALSFLERNFRARGEWRVSALPHRAVDINCVPVVNIDTKRALRSLPPLIKGYVRLGAMIGEHAVVDDVFGTTDVLIILPVTHLNPRYVSYYGENATRHRAV